MSRPEKKEGKREEEGKEGEGWGKREERRAISELTFDINLPKVFINFLF